MQSVESSAPDSYSVRNETPKLGSYSTLDPTLEYPRHPASTDELEATSAWHRVLPHFELRPASRNNISAAVRAISGDFSGLDIYIPNSIARRHLCMHTHLIQVLNTLAESRLGVAFVLRQEPVYRLLHPDKRL